MKKDDIDPTRCDDYADSHRLDPHPEAHRLEEHPEPKELPAHKVRHRAAAATPLTTPADNMVAATSDAQETHGFARGAGWVALGILALMVVAAMLWRPHTRYNTEMAAIPANYTAPTGTVIAAVPNPGDIVLSDLVVEEAYTPAAQPARRADAYTSGTATASAPSAVVVYLFNTDSSDIPETSTLTDVARMANKSGKTVVVKAYTDETGRAAYNRRLSERRAKAVGDYMVAHGVPASHIKAKGYGPTHAYANNAQDRRAEISLE